MPIINEKPGQVTFGQAFKNFFKGYVDFYGRTTRAGYWWVQLILLPVVAVFVFVLMFSMGMALFGALTTISGMNEPGLYGTGPGMSALSLAPFQVLLFLGAVLMVTLIMPNMTLNVRRYRDAGLRGRGYFAIWLAQVVVGIGYFIFALGNILTTAGEDWYNVSSGAVTLFGGQWLVNLLTAAVNIFLLVVTILPTDTMLVSPNSNKFLQFFFRVRESDGMQGGQPQPVAAGPVQTPNWQPLSNADSAAQAPQPNPAGMQPPVADPNQMGGFQQPMANPNPAGAQPPVTDPNQMGSVQQPMANPNPAGMQQPPVADPNAGGVQQPVTNPNQMGVQQPMPAPNQMGVQQPMPAPNQMGVQQPVADPNQLGGVQQPMADPSQMGAQPPVSDPNQPGQ